MKATMIRDDPSGKGGNSNSSGKGRSKGLRILLGLVLAGGWMISRNAPLVRSSWVALTEEEIGMVELDAPKSPGTISKAEPPAAKPAGATASTMISIPPSQMKVRYHELWNHTTSTIDVPPEYQNPFPDAWIVVDPSTGARRRPRTSLEILADVLHGERYRHEFRAVDTYLQQQTQGGTSATPPSCLLPNTTATRELAEAQQQQLRSKHNDETPRHKKSLPLPILNVGYPKVGSTTLQEYFQCIGLRANHGQIGAKLFQNLRNGEPFLGERRAHDAYCQLDFNKPPGYYPQIALLDELHEVFPNATLVMNFRPFDDWATSLQNWHGMYARMLKFELPGLPNQNVTRKGRNLRNDQILAKWWCGHVLHLREYVREYPTHALVELDLYDAAQTEALLDALVRGGSKSNNTATRDPHRKRCWGHANTNHNKTRTTETPVRNPRSANRKAPKKPRKRRKQQR